jgi:hypothetical protein
VDALRRVLGACGKPKPSGGSEPPIATGDPLSPQNSTHLLDTTPPLPDFSQALSNQLPKIRATSVEHCEHVEPLGNPGGSSSLGLQDASELFCSAFSQRSSGSANSEDGAKAASRRTSEASTACSVTRPLVLGIFSAGSEVTGAAVDTVVISQAMHKAGAFVAFDYSAVGATRAMGLEQERGCSGDGVYNNPLADGDLICNRPDAAMLAPHCIPGGPGANGVLVVNRPALRKSLAGEDGAPQVAALR